MRKLLNLIKGFLSQKPPARPGRKWQWGNPTGDEAVDALYALPPHFGGQQQGFLIESAKFLIGHDTAAALAVGGGICIAPQNISGTATNSAWISMRRGQRLAFIITTGAWAGGTPAVTVNQAVDVAGTSSKALNFTRCFTFNSTTVGDLPTEVTGLSGSQNLPNQANAGLIIEINANDLDVNNGFQTVQLAVASPGSNNDYLAAIAILYGIDISGKPSTIPTATTL